MRCGLCRRTKAEQRARYSLRIAETDIPEDFDAFWLEAEAEAKAVKLDYHRSFRSDFDLPGLKVETIEFAGMDGQILHGWLAYPPEARRLPGFLWIPPYGRESLLPNAYGTRDGFVSMSWNFFGHDAYYQEKYAIDRGYFAEGALAPETWIFRRMYQNASVAARVLRAQIEVDEDRIGSMGMSQGGGISIWLGAWCDTIRAVCADMPFLGSMRSTLAGSVYRYPLKELVDFMDTVQLGRERVLRTLDTFDTAHVATRCFRPTRIALGLRDPAARPMQVRAIYDALPGPKELVELDWGHDWHEEMIEGNRQWLLNHL